MNRLLLRCWLRLYRAGWFSPSLAGGFPVPARWQGWLALAAFIVLVAATVRLHGEAAFAVRSALGIGYIALSVIASD